MCTPLPSQLQPLWAFAQAVLLLGPASPSPMPNALLIPPQLSDLSLIDTTSRKCPRPLPEVQSPSILPQTLLSPFQHGSQELFPTLDNEPFEGEDRLFTFHPSPTSL